MGAGDEEQARTRKNKLEIAMARAKTSKNISLKFEWARSRVGRSDRDL
jgi:hypothetical protein